MKRKSDKVRQETFTAALQGKKIPILTLDSKWYKLLDENTRTMVKGTENKLNALLKRQGKLNTEIGEIRKLKKKLMDEIVPLVSEADQTGDKSLDKKIERNKRLVEECNERLENHNDELKELPGEIDRLNMQLMMTTMDRCYDAMQENAEEIDKIEAWVKEIRVELKERLVRKQEMEQKNYEIYSYMHDVFGADVVNVFDVHYDLEKKHVVKQDKGEQAGADDSDGRETEKENGEEV